jgi:hypothetical protein
MFAAAEPILARGIGMALSLRDAEEDARIGDFTDRSGANMRSSSRPSAGPAAYRSFSRSSLS